MTNSILDWRDRISVLWHANVNRCLNSPNQGFNTNDQYIAFCAAKDWIQDTAEAIQIHRNHGFSQEPHKAYLEFWGILQSVFVQQDAINQLEYAFTGQKEIDRSKDWYPGWREIREMRNLAVGHPTNKGGNNKENTIRCVTGRQEKSYASIPLTIYEGSRHYIKHLNLGELLDAYDLEAAQILKSIFEHLENQLRTDNGDDIPLYKNPSSTSSTE